MVESTYRRWLILNGRKPLTIFRHIKTLRVLLRELKSWDKESVDEFIVNLKENKNARNSTLNSYIGVIRGYAKCMDLSDALKSYKFFKAEHSIIRGTLSDGEIEAFLNMPRYKGAPVKEFEKAQLFFRILAYTGMRPNEVATLHKDQITDRLIILRDTKTGRPRNIPIPDPLKKPLQEYLGELVGDLLFTTQRGKPYSDHFWIPAFNKRLKLLSIHRPNLTTYSFRHSMATSLLRANQNASKISKLLGNSPKQIFESYDHLVIEDVEQALNSHPMIASHIENNMTSSEVLTGLKNLVHDYVSRHQTKLTAEISDMAGELKITVKL